MTVHPCPRSLVSTAFAAALFIAVPVMAIDDTTRAVEQLVTIGDQVKAVLPPDLGFPADKLVHWHAAVDAAFLPELLEADVLQALEVQLDPDSRDAALAFNASPLGQEMSELIAALADMTAEVEAERVAAANAYVETASVEQNGLLVDLFEMQLGPRHSSEIMDVYFRAMKMAAEPIIGAAAANDWMDGWTDGRMGRPT